MKVWMVNREFAGKFLPIIDGSTPNFGGFDFHICNSNADEIEVVARCEEAEYWLPSIKAGVTECCQRMQTEGERFCGVKIEITGIYAHSLDTTEKVMRSRGWMLMHELTRQTRSGGHLEFIEE